MEGRSLLPLIAGKLGREFAISEYKKSIHIMKEVEKAKMCKNKLENFFFPLKQAEVGERIVFCGRLDRSVEAVNKLKCLRNLQWTTIIYKKRYRAPKGRRSMNFDDQK